MRRLVERFRRWLGGPEYPEHTGATPNWRPMAEVRAQRTAPELQAVSPEVKLLHQAQAELDVVNHAIARFSSRVGDAIAAFLGDLEATGELSRHELNRLLAEGRELEPIR